MIGKINVAYDSLTVNDNGESAIIFKVAQESNYAAKSISSDIRKNIKDGKENKFIISIDEYKNARTLDQNALMWALLDILANALNASRTGGVKPEDIYVEMLSKYGTWEYVCAVPEAIDILRSAFRVVKEIERREINGKIMAWFKCYLGSSKYDTKQMANLIDGILDDLAFLGVDSAEYRYWRKEWENR